MTIRWARMGLVLLMRRDTESYLVRIVLEEREDTVMRTSPKGLPNIFWDVWTSQRKAEIDHS
jgi:hypothetical protein